MDTPIRLVSYKSQTAFLDEISTRRLKRMMKNKHSLTLIATKWVLGRDCLEYKHKYRVNTNIFSHFIASMLDIGIPRPLVLRLLKEIFTKK